MKGLERYVGEVLDEKYRLERLLGQGGMGAVYLATHLGTERYVALKLIAPQFMRNPEFVERFKREARAAGRLRHPNVVDVTDFGFSGNGEDRVAYLVMEYLDGCTLSDVLAEDDRLPLYWAVDILEQVCSAVHEAHQQGIVHRDLKPDNIWLEPSGLGGYRVKVLDFGIAKLAETGAAAPEPTSPAIPSKSAEDTRTIHYSDSPLARTAAAGAAELVPTRLPAGSLANLESETLIQPVEQIPEQPRATQELMEGDQTRLFDGAAQQTAGAHRPGHRITDAHETAATSGLTRVGAILGTPLYMSPEQCRGESLDARSDIYSLGIIAYQMLAGSPPFKGDTTSIIRAHCESSPTVLREQNRKISKRVSRVIMSALEKEPAKRPQTAVALANAMRANSDGLGALYRRAFALYSEYFPKFIKLSLLAHIPVILVTLMALAWRLSQARMGKVAEIATAIPLGLLQIAASFVTASTISGVTAIIVTQLAVAPHKPVELRAAFRVLRARWRPFLKTGILISLRIVLGFILLVIPGIVMTIRYSLWAPVVLMEGLETKAARKRARTLASRSWRTIIFAMCIQFLVPAIVGAIFGAFIGSTADKKGGHLRVEITSQVSALIRIFVLPLMSIVPALLYLKMRQFGGETLSDVIAQIEQVEGARSDWQERMRTRLIVNTPRSFG
ncbi:MAG: serine/threonine-protein kinase [Acidobacteriota bacterium]